MKFIQLFYITVLLPIVIKSVTINEIRECLDKVVEECSICADGTFIIITMKRK